MRIAVRDQRISKKPMKKSRGTELVYRPTYVDKGTGEWKAASTWWIQYSVRERRFRESSGSRMLALLLWITHRNRHFEDRPG